MLVERLRHRMCKQHMFKCSNLMCDLVLAGQDLPLLTSSMNCTAAELETHGGGLVSRSEERTRSLDVLRVFCIPLPVVVLESGRGNVDAAGEATFSTEIAWRGRFAAGCSTEFSLFKRLSLGPWPGP